LALYSDVFAEDQGGITATAANGLCILAIANVTAPALGLRFTG
jgi:hypothetical protein